MSSSNVPLPTQRRLIGEKLNMLNKYTICQMSYLQMAKETGLTEDQCRLDIERRDRILNPSGDIILYPDRLPWYLLDKN